MNQEMWKVLWFFPCHCFLPSVSCLAAHYLFPCEEKGTDNILPRAYRSTKHIPDKKGGVLYSIATRC